MDYEKYPLPEKEYENCKFINCNFYKADLSEILFIDCDFTDCNLSLSKLLKTVFRDVKFNDCKMPGLHFDTCSEFGLSFNFDHCILDHSSFYQVKTRKIFFKNSQLHEADFTGCDLTGSVFYNCDLKNAIFENTIIEKADFRRSYNYSIDPDKNKIRKAVFSLESVEGLLFKYDIQIDS